MGPVKRALKSVLVSTIPALRDLLDERDRLRAENGTLIANLDQVRTERDRLKAEGEGFKTWVPPGHFYSPIPSIKEIRARAHVIFNRTITTLPGIEINQAEQLRLLDRFLKYSGEEGFAQSKTDGRRYYYENDQFPYGDAFFLYCMMRHFAPKKIIEIGAGFSSGVMLDTNERFFDGSIELTMVRRTIVSILLLSTARAERCVAVGCRACSADQKKAGRSPLSSLINLRRLGHWRRSTSR